MPTIEAYGKLTRYPTLYGQGLTLLMLSEYLFQETARLTDSRWQRSGLISIAAPTASRRSGRSDYALVPHIDRLRQ